ncbi:S66 family peptidase [Nesterenkonia muleiensis]|uniref:S66 family peptidase n=1 Tax=Nesterenkonia muleiensis TaxID=2282648 RepID=UPI00192E3019|nr:S66 peptidase family protein [Nesterenkonia muleiensis]
MADRPPVIPPRLRAGDEVRVVAPSRSRSLIMEHDNTQWINDRFHAMGLTLSFGTHVDEDDEFRSSSIASRVDDLHAAFADPNVAGILTVIGGFNSNELLPHLDWDLISSNPKIFCGYSDITALSNAIYARTGLVTYSGPHWSSFGMSNHFEPTGDWFRAALMSDEPINLHPATTWIDDLWFLDQDSRSWHTNEGWWILQEGQAEGRLIGGNLCTLNLLQGTEWMPPLDGAVLFLEDDSLSSAVTFARDLTSLLQLPDAEGIKGLLIGRFQQESGLTRELLAEIVSRQPALQGLPVLANLDFGHTSPMLTLPVGGTAAISTAGSAEVTVSTH